MTPPLPPEMMVQFFRGANTVQHIIMGAQLQMEMVVFKPGIEIQKAHA